MSDSTANSQPPRSPDDRQSDFADVVLERDFNLTVWLKRETGAIVLPPDFPKTVTPPKYTLGAQCRWVPAPETDWGTVIGQIYVPSETSAQQAMQWSWLYLLLLDRDSPSCQWLAADWVPEQNLEPLYLMPLEET